MVHVTRLLFFSCLVTSQSSHVFLYDIYLYVVHSRFRPFPLPFRHHFCMILVILTSFSIVTSRNVPFTQDFLAVLLVLHTIFQACICTRISSICSSCYPAHNGWLNLVLGLFGFVLAI